MNKLLVRIFTLSVFLITLSCSTPSGNKNSVILMKTSLGDIKLKLYDNTPQHRDNFLKLVNSDFYEGISFHRVINKFMIQSGDPITRTVPIAKTADSLNTYTIPAEFRKEYFHRKGALAAARDGNDINPEMRSSGTQFYIVQGTVLNDEELNQSEQRINSNIRQALFGMFMKEVSDSVSKAGIVMTDGNIQEKASEKMFNYLAVNPGYKISEDQRTVYKSVGGVPRLDQTYTVFGEVIEGLDVVDKIAAVQTDAGDRPVKDVRILKIKIIRN
jgi:Peptidyl-prolyl cis-trans isomerase (rotamase) - cyclophilin family